MLSWLPLPHISVCAVCTWCVHNIIITYSAVMEHSNIMCINWCTSVNLSVYVLLLSLTLIQ